MSRIRKFVIAGVLSSGLLAGGAAVTLPALAATPVAVYMHTAPQVYMHT